LLLSLLTLSSLLLSSLLTLLLVVVVVSFRVFVAPTYWPSGHIEPDTSVVSFVE
jgi:hypothetical protein